LPDSKEIVAEIQIEAAKVAEARGKTIPKSTAAAARHSDDFRSVHWFGTDYTFTPTQAACIKVLWRAWDNGTPDVGQQAILEDIEVEADSKRLVDLFKNQRAWGTMIVRGGTSGAYRLAEPSESR